VLRREDVILFSGGAQGAEAGFGACAERFGIEEVNFSFDGHQPVRTRGLRVLNHEELNAGDVSLAYVSRLMSRRYPDTPTFRKILQSIWYQINNGQEIYVIGAIQPDATVRGGTGWGASSRACASRSCVRPGKNGWFEGRRPGEVTAQRSRRAGIQHNHHGNRHPRAQPGRARPSPLHPILDACGRNVIIAGHHLPDDVGIVVVNPAILSTPGTGMPFSGAPPPPCWCFTMTP
jgi:hypothetical protein